jgi:predicted membrane-bound spermidine synthase
MLVYARPDKKWAGNGTMAERHESRWLKPAALFVFALSGAAGLIYQSIWSQYLGLYLGHAAYAQSLVLAIFMGGMALGAWWASRRSLHWRNLLRAYALIELIIGIAAALFHPIYLGVTGFAYDSAFLAMPGGWAVQAFKWTSGALLILPQAVLLGTTFPLMSNGLMRRLRKEDGAILGGLYFTNSMGAAIGALLATFVLLPAIGLPGAMRFGAVLNLVVAIAAWLLARSPEHLQAPIATTGTPQERSGIARLLLVAAFITGATSFVYEIGWVRMLSLAFGSTVHAFELMLAAFIGGLACGGWWIRKRIDGYADPIRVGGLVQIAMGLAALASLLLYDRSFDWVAWFMKALSRSDGGYAIYNIVTGAVSMLMMAPAAFFAGMTLPLFTYALLRNGGGEASVGRIYAANTVGAIAGVFAAVHFLVPVLGLKLAMCIAAAGDLALGLVLLRRTGVSANAPDTRYLGALAGCGLALMATLVLARFDPDLMASGVYRTGVPSVSGNGLKVMTYRDGKTASISTRRAKNGIVAISTNGKVDASLNISADGEPPEDEITMILAGVLPLMHSPNPRSAAVIGFGSGLTTHTLLGDPRLESVDTIEIEPAMVDGARVFGKRVERAYDDRRSHIHFEDAKTYFAANRSRYDLIVAEPSNPWVSGVAGLFSREFYQFVPRHLQPNGLLVQWLQLYEINDELVASVVNALSASFQDYRIYLSNGLDMLIVARADGPVEDLHADLLTAPLLAPELRRVGIASMQDIIAHQIGDRRSLEPLFDALSARATSDFHPALSLEAPMTRFGQQAATAILHLPTADLPYRSALAGLGAPSPKQIVDNPAYKYTGEVFKANRIASALRDGALPDREGDVASFAKVSLVREVAGACHSNERSDPFVGDALVDLAAKTIPFLETTAARETWNSPAWITCTAQSVPVQRLLAVIAALAREDWKTLQDGAAASLRDDAQSWSPALKDWLLRAAMLGAVMSGDDAAVSGIDNELGKRVAGKTFTVPYRSYMLAIADRRSAGKKLAQPAVPAVR